MANWLVFTIVVRTMRGKWWKMIAMTESRSLTLGVVQKILATACFSWIIAIPCDAQMFDPFVQTSLDEEAGIVTSSHGIVLEGNILTYTARAGHIPIRDNATGQAHGMMFFISYSLERESEGARPITFLWNGGPGSSSSLVHLLGFGPKRLDSSGAVIVNDGTWLEFSDLVFVDPIGTGYSRPTRPDYGAEFYQDRGDAESVAEFVRVFLTRADAWDAPLFLAGESFGVLRATRVEDVLRRRSIAVAGLMNIGLVPPLATISEEVSVALTIPTYAAAAIYHGQLDGDFETMLRESTRWALQDYAPALTKLEGLSANERARLRADLSRFTGVSLTLADSTLVLGMGPFSERLLREDGLVIGRYDSRLTGQLDTTQVPYDPTSDPSLKDNIDDVGVVRYMREELGFRSDLQYQGPFGGGYPSPNSFRGDWMSVLWDRSETSRAAIDDRSMDATPAVERVLRANQDLRIYVACGYFDLVCPYSTIDHMVEIMDPSLANRITVRTYHGGHAIYMDDSARLQMRADVETFVRARTARLP